MTRSSFLTDLLSTIFERRSAASVDDDSRSLEALCTALLSAAGEVSGSKIAAAILSRYGTLDATGKAAFFRFLTEDFDLDPDQVQEKARAYGAAPDRETLGALLTAAEPRRQELLRRLNQVPGATAQLVAMRLDLLGMLKEHPSYARTDLDFVHLLSSWFNRGFLVLRRINWGAPANILEKVIAYEAVHAIGDWDDLRRRLQPADRRCFAFFHPSMPDEPLIFVEVALTSGIPSSIQAVLAEDRRKIAASEADTAVFYSISNCQSGLKGISFGNSLIKQVVHDLSVELPHLKTFVTLSPIPGLRRWLEVQAEQGPDETAKRLLAAATPDGAGDGGLVESADTLRRYAAKYLAGAKRPDRFPIDPVARFHLGNGASLYDVHPGADVSKKGLQQSCGAMVNYLYRLDSVEQNHEEYVNNRTVAQSRTVQTILRSRAADAKTKRTAHA